MMAVARCLERLALANLCEFVWIRLDARMSSGSSSMSCAVTLGACFGVVDLPRHSLFCGEVLRVLARGCCLGRKVNEILAEELSSQLWKKWAIMCPALSMVWQD